MSTRTSALRAARPSGRDGRGGFSLLEVMISVLVASAAMVVVGNILMSSTNSVDALMVDTGAEQEIKTSLARMMNELAISSTSVVTLDTASDTSHDILTLQTPGPFTGVVTWGCVDSTGAWNSGWQAKYKVTGGRLVRQVWNGAVQVGSDEVFVRTVDDLVSGVKGFRVTAAGSVYNVLLRVRKTWKNGSNYTKEFSSSIRLQNT